MRYCKICHLHIPDDEHTFKEVTGWVGGPKKDSMRLRQDTGNFAHADCILITTVGQDPAQPSLFDETETAYDKNVRIRKAIDDQEELL